MKEKRSHTHHQPKGTSLPDLVRFVLDTRMYNPTQPAPSHILSHSKSRVATLEMASHTPSANVQVKKTQQKSLDRRYSLLSCRGYINIKSSRTTFLLPNPKQTSCAQMAPVSHSKPSRPCLPSPPWSPWAASAQESKLAQTENAQIEPSKCPCWVQLLSEPD